MTTEPRHTEPTPDPAATPAAPEQPVPSAEESAPPPQNRAERRAAKHGKHAGRNRREWEQKPKP